jgi:hypothetical protein
MLPQLTCGAILVAIGALTPIPSAAARAPEARVAAGCRLGNGEHDGYTYVASLAVAGTTCAGALQVVRHRGRLRGWRCANRVLARSPAAVEGRETCARGDRRLVYVYSEHTG